MLRHGAQNALAASFDGMDVRLSLQLLLRMREMPCPHLAARCALAQHIDNAASIFWLQIHGAHGYLLEEFLKTSTNKRTDQYGERRLGGTAGWLSLCRTTQHCVCPPVCSLELNERIGQFALAAQQAAL